MTTVRLSYCKSELDSDLPQMACRLLNHMPHKPRFLFRIYQAAIVLLIAASMPGIAHGGHPCAPDARIHAERLLNFHGGKYSYQQLSVDDNFRLLAPIPALIGDGLLDVLEVKGHIYRTNYRMRFMYAQFSESCVLAGQEIFEIADPY